MKKILTLAAALIVLGASTAMAAGGLNLFYNGCPADGGISALTFACNTNTGNNVLMASVIVPADMPQFIGVTAVFDATVNDVALPAWWQTATGQCSANRVGVSFDASVFFNTNCPDIWGGAPPLPVFAVQQGLHGANTVRFNSGAALPSTSPNPLTASMGELDVCKITIGHAKTVGTGACAGCTDGVCIVYNETKLVQPAGVGDYTLTTPAVSNFVTFNSGGPACPQATPAQNRTWGAVKSLYR